MSLQQTESSGPCAQCHRHGTPSARPGRITLSFIWFDTASNSYICERCETLNSGDYDALDRLELSEAYARRDHEAHDEGF